MPWEKQPNPEGIKTRVAPGGGEKQGKGERGEGGVRRESQSQSQSQEESLQTEDLRWRTEKEEKLTESLFVQNTVQPLNSPFNQASAGLKFYKTYQAVDTSDLAGN